MVRLSSRPAPSFTLTDFHKDVLIIDGLTKRFRLPGWRVAWILGPKEFIKAIGSCGSYLDGGTNVPFQEAAVPMLEVSQNTPFCLFSSSFPYFQ